MILAIGSNYRYNDYVRSANSENENLSFNDIYNKFNRFIILDGIDYKSTSTKSTLYYMEV